MQVSNHHNSRRFMLPLPLLGVSIVLAGCNQVALPDFSTTGSVFGAAQAPAFEHVITEKRPVQEAFLQLPPHAGRVLDVTQSRHGNGVEQLIIYQGDHSTRGENAARVRLVTKGSQFGRRSANLKIPSTSAGQIVSELKKALPDVAMRISNQFHTNAYGPFGYALGRSQGNVACIYGWQNMHGTANDRWAIIRGASAKPELSIRLRVCRASASPESLVNLMRNLRVEADPAQALRPTAVSWNSGARSDLTTALPQYVPGGYLSDETVAAVSEPPLTIAKPVKKQRVRKLMRRKPEAQIMKKKAVYRPPLPQQKTAYSDVPKPNEADILSSQKVDSSAALKALKPTLLSKKEDSKPYSLVPLP